MNNVLLSVCHGNHRGYEGTKEEIDEMFEKCFEECENYGMSPSSMSSLHYNYKNRHKLEPEDNGLYQVTYWSKW